MSIKQSNATKLSTILLISVLLLSSNLAAGELVITQRNQVSAQAGFSQKGKLDLQGLASNSINPESSALLESSIGAAVADGNETIQIVVGMGSQPLDYAQITEIVSRYGGKVADAISMDNSRVLVLTVPTKSASLVTKAIGTTGVAKYVEPSIEYHINMEPNDPYWNGSEIKQWGPQKVQADYAWNTTTGSSSILVAVVDTGIDYNHPDLQANYIPLGRDWVNNDADPKDDNGHGTHCAGIIAATLNNGIGIAGLAQVKIMSEKALSASGSGGSVGLANAIVDAVDQGAKIISNSWGSNTESQVISQAIDYAVAHGVLVLVAAGNSGKEEKEYPASNPQVVSVGATNIFDTIASFSTYGDWVDVSAPGVMIYSTMPTYHVDMNNEPRFTMTYSYANGTSMACPMAAGVAALILSKYPNMTANLLRYQLENTCDDLGAPGIDKYFGHGRVNAKTGVEQTLPNHDVVAMDWDTPFDNIKIGSATKFTASLLNHAFTNESDVEVRLVVNNTVVNSTHVSIPYGQYAYPTLSWTPATDGTYNVTMYATPISGETITLNNAISGSFHALLPPSSWTLVAEDGEGDYGCDLNETSTEANAGIMYFKVGFYNSWTNMHQDVDVVILVDADRNQRTGLPDQYYPDQYTYLGADYAIVVGSDGFEIWKWDMNLNYFDSSNPITLAYLDAPENSNEFIVGVYMTDLATDGSIDFNVVDAVGWDWVFDVGNVPFISNLQSHEITVTELITKSLQTNCNLAFWVFVNNAGSSEESVNIQLILNDTVTTDNTIVSLPPGYRGEIFCMLNFTGTDVYNITAYAKPVTGETSIANNIRSTLVSVGDKIALISDNNELASAMTKLDSMYVGYDVFNYNAYYEHPCTEFPMILQMYHTVFFYNYNRRINETEQNTLNDYLAHGGNLLVTGWDSLGYPDDPRLADVVRSSTYGDNDDGAEYDLTVTNSSHPIMNGPYGQFSVGRNVTDLFGDTDRATADGTRGAVTVATLNDGYAKIIATESIPGTVVYWNGDADYDWVYNTDCANMLQNMLSWFNSTTSPITTTDYDGLWHRSNFTINLAPDSYFNEWFGVPETYYRVNGGASKTLSIDGQPIITTEGNNNTVEYWSIDTLGYQEAHHTLKGIKLDKTAPTSYAGPSQTVTVDQLVAFDGSGSSDVNGLVNYSWNFGDGTYGTGVAPTHSYQSAGIYVAILTVEDPAGNTAWSGVTITVNSPSGSGSSSSSQSSSSSTPTPNPTPTPAPTPTPTPSSNTIPVTRANEPALNIPISGNITSAQITNASLTVDQSAAKATLSFTITGEKGTVGYGNVTVPKTSVPTGATPQIFIDDVLCQNQGYTEDQNNFYVWWTTTFSTHQMAIVFAGTAPAPVNPLWYIIGAVVFALVVVAVTVLAFKRRA